MRMSKLGSCATICVAVLLFTLPSRAQADTYQILHLANDSTLSITGIYGSGAVVLSTDLFSYGGCTPAPYASNSCYITYVNGLAFNGSDTRPTITDSGGPAGSGCFSLPSSIPAYAISFDLCNNGHEVYGIGTPYHNPDGSFAKTGVFDGPDLINDFIGGHYPSNLHVAMNSYGDIVWDDVGYEEILEAYDVTSHLSQVPEPGSWTLISIGILAAATFSRRRRLGNQSFNS